MKYGNSQQLFSNYVRYRVTYQVINDSFAFFLLLLVVVSSSRSSSTNYSSISAVRTIIFYPYISYIRQMGQLVQLC